jgi:hypothetical protein
MIIQEAQRRRTLRIQRQHDPRVAVRVHQAQTRPPIPHHREARPDPLLLIHEEQTRPVVIPDHQGRAWGLRSVDEDDFPGRDIADRGPSAAREGPEQHDQP